MTYIPVPSMQLIDIKADLIIFALGVAMGAIMCSRFFKTHKRHLTRQLDLLSTTVEILQRQDQQRRLRFEKKRLDDELHDITKHENQLRFLSECSIYATRPVNREAALNVLYELQNWISSHRPTWRVGFEVAMGSFIKTEKWQAEAIKDRAFRSYNSKRVDFLLIDNYGKPMLAVEYNGTGHDLSADAASRMAVKRCALERAGIPLLEIGQFEKHRLQNLLTESFATPAPPREPEPATAY
ncbi:DUF2726 domain-containing protein [Brucella pseudogrignonensis]|uniref:DUF2726 domain-containing protein n=1 Tax=Brucella pseudogrignonensis TaxID=419475 RepID=UPI00190DCEB7|nr:DUF2726 domain-containing protein [Brucella pseudogrignonensis]MBK0022923.1 DUF2726 domain-containing protein [Ochrobactrum sp. S45]MBK0044938.1 DUF2726 domain-containing protein [Ochrobactrum sp. S46]UKK95314.1 DUF2726 domain-containing protein [Brucella pseudogrignonensis]